MSTGPVERSSWAETAGAMRPRFFARLRSLRSASQAQVCSSQHQIHTGAGPIDLLRGHPAPEHLPHSILADALQHTAQRAGGSADELPLGYGPRAGNTEFLRLLAGFINEEGEDSTNKGSLSSQVAPSNLFTSNGVSHALELVANVFSGTSIAASTVYHIYIVL